ncbi:hypothetical protein EMIHUDRAFT_204812 [Emiliania huxleyi CCMP1516]|uniref:Uncharacterized protein n=2 Tax=Emiliania huxleyi TaxID=2903 RepID=A0A0D3JWE4_EMIH1|nr:hypothetical protein EMIHUDRAFT_204812 [Emiliania huxleyi CCMP1516]EOD27829.1 hypothetical protein EMIHUDRAFT_204812 [Emiliania huxleyi CCMP1516]|eukprot:XP_005780258.1 hypothetical protein EMIHUDRAFT_204812 [Emiliania huxleyi CCMP1516]
MSADTDRYGGASPGVLLASLLRDKEGALPEAQTCTDVVTLLNALVACSGNPAALVDELSSAGVDDALTEIEPLFSSSPDLALQVQPSGKGTLWSSLPKAPPIDEAAVRERFTATPLQRSNQIQIALAKFKGRGILAAAPLSLEQRGAWTPFLSGVVSLLCLKVLALDETVRKPRAASDDIARLRECSPSAEEVEMLSPFGEDPRLKETLTFEQRKKDAEAQVEAINKAVQCLRGSKTLPLLLALVLQALGKLAETKSTVSDARPAQTSLLHYAATLSSAGVAEELDGLCKAIGEPLSELDVLGSELSSPEYGGKGDGVEGMLSGLQQLHAYWGTRAVHMSLKRGEFEDMKKLQSELQTKIQSRRTYTAGAHGGR